MLSKSTLVKEPRGGEHPAPLSCRIGHIMMASFVQFYRPQGKVMFSHTSVILFTIDLMDTQSLLILVSYSVTPCYGAVSTHPTGMLSYYRLKRSFGLGNIFTNMSHSVHRGGVPDQAPPWTRQVTPRPVRYTLPPEDQAGTPPGPDPPLRPGRYHPPRPGRLPPDQAGTPRPSRYRSWDQTPPRTRLLPPGTADSGIRSTFGRYASYWNAFLLFIFLGLSRTSYRIHHCGYMSNFTWIE